MISPLQVVSRLLEFPFSFLVFTLISLFKLPYIVCYFRFTVAGALKDVIIIVLQTLSISQGVLELREGG